MIGRLFGPACALLLVSGCNGAPENGALAEAEARGSNDALKDGRIECALEGAKGFDRTCTIDEMSGADGAILVYNYGAHRCVDSLLPRLDRAGFLLIRDYGNTVDGEPAHAAGGQRFGEDSHERGRRQGEQRHERKSVPFR